MVQRDVGSSREPRSHSTMSQHVPMSPRARTAADIIIVYSRRPWESRRYCIVPSPPLVVTAFLGEGWLQCESGAWYARAGRCLVSPIRLRVSCGRVEFAAVRESTLPNDDYRTRFHYEQLGRQQRRLRRATRRASAKRAGVPPPQFGFGADGDCRWSRTRDEDLGFCKIRTWDCLSGLQ